LQSGGDRFEPGKVHHSICPALCGAEDAKRTPCLKNMSRRFWQLLWEEIDDFFEDFTEAIFRTRFRRYAPRHVQLGGVSMAVRPAVLFADRLDTLLKLVFGVSITVSAWTATFVGFVKLSDLLDVLISTTAGRACMMVIGLCATLSALWKLLQIKDVNAHVSLSRQQEGGAGSVSEIDDSN
jgi:hypothetical protein